MHAPLPDGGPPASDGEGHSEVRGGRARGDTEPQDWPAVATVIDYTDARTITRGRPGDESGTRTEDAAAHLPAPTGASGASGHRQEPEKNPEKKTEENPDKNRPTIDTPTQGHMHTIRHTRRRALAAGEVSFLLDALSGSAPATPSTGRTSPLAEDGTGEWEPR